MKFVVENIFKCLVLFWKCYFPTNFSHFLGYFLSIQTNFIKKISKSQPTPHTTETPIRPTAANSGNQKPQPPKHHYHTTTQQQQKSKSQREISGSKLRLRGGEIEQRDRAARDRSSDWSVRSSASSRSSNWSVRSSDCSVRSSDPETTIWASPATSKAWYGFLLRARSLSLSLSPSLFARLTRKWFEVKIWASNHFRGQRLIFLVNFK